MSKNYSTFQTLAKTVSTPHTKTLVQLSSYKPATSTHQSVKPLKMRLSDLLLIERLVNLLNNNLPKTPQEMQELDSFGISALQFSEALIFNKKETPFIITK